MDYSKILVEAYDQFMLPLGGKKVPTPYRRNEIGSFQKIGPEFQGKSSPEVLTQTTKRLAQEQNFDLNKASIEEIRQFMIQNKLGIDCSGFAYRVMNYFLKKIKNKTLEEIGLPHVGRTNVAKLTDLEFCREINIEDTQPGDMIKMNSAGDVLHILIILKRQGDGLIYAHSSGQTNPDGVHQAMMQLDKDVQFSENLGNITFDPKSGDGVRRLKILG